MNQITLLPQATRLQPSQNPALVYLASMPSPKSRRTQGQVLVQIAAWLGGELDSIPWGTLQYQHTTAIRTRAIQDYAPATARKYIAALRGVLKHAWRLGLMDQETYARAADLDPIRQDDSRPPAGRDLSQGEINALIKSCMTDPSPAGVRDAAILSLMYVCLVRRSTVIALSLKDYDPQTGRLLFHGKGNKIYSAYVARGAKAALDDWLTLRGSEPGPLFYPVSQKGQIERRPEFLTDQSIYILCQKRGEEAGVDHFTPHDLRRSGVGELLDRGVDLATVSRIASHDDPKTTARYDRRPEDVKRDAATKLHVPYVARTPQEETTK